MGTEIDARESDEERAEACDDDTWDEENRRAAYDEYDGESEARYGSCGMCAREACGVDFHASDVFVVGAGASHGHLDTEIDQENDDRDATEQEISLRKMEQSTTDQTDRDQDKYRWLTDGRDRKHKRAPRIRYSQHSTDNNSIELVDMISHIKYVCYG